MVRAYCKIVLTLLGLAFFAACNGREDVPGTERVYTLDPGGYGSVVNISGATGSHETIGWGSGEKVFVVFSASEGKQVDVKSGEIKVKVPESSKKVTVVRGPKLSLSDGAVIINPSLNGQATDAALASGRTDSDNSVIEMEPIAAALKFTVATEGAKRISLGFNEAAFPISLSFNSSWGKAKVLSKKKTVIVSLNGAGEYYLPIIPGVSVRSMTLELWDSAGETILAKSGALEWDSVEGGMLDLGAVEILSLEETDIPLPDPSITPSETISEAVTKMGVGMNLTGLEHCWESLMTKPQRDNPLYYETAGNYGPITLKTMQTIAAAGYKCVRVPVTWHLHMDDVATGAIDKAWLDRVEEVVNFGLQAGLYVIINLHHDAGTILGVWCIADLEHYAHTSAGLVNIWTQVAERFKDHDYKLLFEAYNEMLDGDNTWTYPKKASSMEVLNQLAQDFVNAVRRTGGKNSTRNLIVTTYASSYNERVVEGLRLPKDVASGHIFPQIHCYVPNDFTSQVATGRNNLEDGDYERIVNALEPVRQTFTEKGIPCILGEFGAFPREGRSEDDRATHTAWMTGLCLERKIVPIIWYNPLSNAERSEGVWKYTNIRDAMIDTYNEFIANQNN